LSRIEPGAIGSALVLVALIGAIGYGGYSMLNEVQRVTVAPVENTPDVLADLDPLAGMAIENEDVITPETIAAFQPPSDEGLDRLYRPQALDVPVMIARDAPISTLDPARGGALAGALPSADRDSSLVLAEVEPQSVTGQPSPRVLADAPPELRVVAVRAAWVRVRSADGTSIFEGVMNAGDYYDVPALEEPPTIRIGESGAIYFAVNGTHYGPAGPRGSVTSNLALDTAQLVASYDAPDITADQDLESFVAELQTGTTPELQQ
jgi:hypothetical protein